MRNNNKMQLFNFKTISKDTLNEYHQKIMDTLNQAIDNCVKTEGNRIYKNTVAPIIQGYTEIDPYINVFTYVMNFFEDEEMRDLAFKKKEEISKCLISSRMRRDLYNAFKSYETSTYEKEKMELTNK